jgi:hypothetical protein
VRRHSTKWSEKTVARKWLQYTAGSHDPRWREGFFYDEIIAHSRILGVRIPRSLDRLKRLFRKGATYQIPESWKIALVTPGVKLIP